MKPRIVYIHGNGASHWSFAWAKWLKAELEKAGYETFFETMPDSVIARKEHWLPFIEHHVKAGENDVIVGWSSGALAAMRDAEVHKKSGGVREGGVYFGDPHTLHPRQSSSHRGRYQLGVLTGRQKF